MLIKKNRKFLCFVLSIIMVLCLLPINALAASITPKTNWYNTSTTVYTISTADELAGFASLVNSGNDFTGKTVKLTADIILNDNAENYATWATTSPANTWAPIGSNYTNKFNGTFDGDNHTIAGIYINSSINDQGLFGVLSGTIKNLGVINSYINAKENAGCFVGNNNGGNISNCYSSNALVTAENCAGGVVGFSYNGIIQNCYNICKVDATIASSGGVVGFTNSSAITNCYNTGTVSGKEAVGGVAGSIYNNTATNCYNTGTVSGSRIVGGVFGRAGNQSAIKCYNTGTVSSSTYDAGGVVGYAENYTITNCYNTGAVSAYMYSGGVAGTHTSGTLSSCYNLGAITNTFRLSGGITGYNTASIINSYNLGTVDGTYSGGIAGFNSNGTVTTCYNAAAVSGERSGGVTSDANPGIVTNSYYDNTLFTIDIGFGTGLSTTQIQNVTNLTGFDANIWINSPTQYGYNGVFSASNPVNKGYLALKAFGYTGDDISIDTQFAKDTDGAYLIKNAYQLDLVRYYSSDSTKVFKLANDIDISPAQYNKTNNASGSWQPIYDLTGIFDGDNHVVSGIYINNIGYNQALFGNLNGTIKNLGMVNGYIKGNIYTAAIVGFNKGTITNCYNACTVTGLDQYTGGIAGYNKTLITNCSNFGTVSGTKFYVGGIAGMSYGGTIASCNNSGTVTTNGSCVYVGGVVGDLYTGTLTNCYNTGNVSGENTVGGVAGSAQSSEDMVNCYNTGAISSSNEYAGGVFGYGVGKLINSYNTGKVTGAGIYTAGIAGRFNGGTVKNSYNTGEISSNNSFVAGIVGYLEASTVENCYNTGTISSHAGAVGAIIGTDNTGTLTNTYFTGHSLGKGVAYMPQTGTTPFAQAVILTVGTSSNMPSQPVFTAANALGANFAVNYTNLNSSLAQLTGNTLTATSAGISSVATATMNITQNELTNSGFTGSVKTILVPISFLLTVQKATPTIGVSASLSGKTLTVDAAIHSGYNPTGDITFNIGASSIGVSSVSGFATASYTVSGGENLSITAEYEGDTNNKSVTSSVLTYDVNKFAQAEFRLMNVPAMLTIGDDKFTLFTQGGSGSGAVTYSSSKPSVLDINATTGEVTVSSVGSTTITATKASDSNYNSISASLPITVEKATPTIGISATANENIVTINAAVNNGYNPTGLIIFKNGTATIGATPIDASGKTTFVYTANGGEKLSLTAEYNGDNNNNSAISSVKSLDIAKLAQNPLKITNVPAYVTVSDSKFILSTTGGSGSGAVTYSSSNASVLAVNATTGEATVTGVGSTTITATKASDSNYISTFATVTITVIDIEDSDNSGSSGGYGSTSPSHTAQEPINTVTVVESPASVQGGTSAVTVSPSSNAFSQPVEVKIKDDLTVKKVIEDAIKASKTALPKDAKIYPLDISVFAKGTDTKVQPNEGETVEIAMPIPNELLADKDSIVVVCVADGKLQVLASRVIEKDGKYYVVFKASHFSPYALVVDTNNKLTASTKANPPTGVN